LLRAELSQFPNDELIDKEDEELERWTNTGNLFPPRRYLLSFPAEKAKNESSLQPLQQAIKI
jgi:hypothetical protein